ncbi:MAG TPA: hypothetical protein VMU07_00900 [Candidatus Paceibacterota bacterium]|nr:hypothetical protein [Candidatus Paceibacterota bacterium]
MNFQNDVPVPVARPKSMVMRILRWTATLLIILGVLTYTWSYIGGCASWRAIFLTNNQVYFGHFCEVPFSPTVTLHNVYYLQVSAGANQDFANTAQSQFKLVQLGNEIHGPTDEMVIPMSQILFWETLRSDSAIVAAIKSLNH